MREVDPGLFPNVVAALREAGVDPARELVPVAPAAHYTMGGIVTDLHGRSSVAGLYAVGETSCTGLHGANRLASNSLSECFVWARRAAASALAEPAHPPDRVGADPPTALTAPDRMAPRPPAAAKTGWADARAHRLKERVPEEWDGQSAPPAANAETRAAMWRDAGIERSAEGLERLMRDPHPLARLIARCARARNESRGAHRRVEHPEADPALEHRHVVVGADGELTWETWD